MAQRTILVLDRAPTEAAARVIALSSMMGDIDLANVIVAWRVLDELPGWVHVGAADQLLAHRRDSGPTACFMLVVASASDAVKELQHGEQAG